ncbi:F-box/LRR-repeat protein 4 [Ditylenchus destructor]|uniref:F-box/LRR-repeat protein 4 n=1 Tax=Ditylenchus destructor TaxID=166010 RepID=A0AAD4MXJ6_9BILA|nr:F-box/LRR-repeat protein 4 [Ditylenchus destructor]
MVKSLFDLSLAEVCRHSLCEDLAFLPCDCKQRLLEFFASHDQINTKKCISLMSSPMFGCNLTRIYFYLSDQLTDEILEALTTYSQNLEQVTIIECPQITDQGIISATIHQRRLGRLELRCLYKITSQALKFLKSPYLHSVDLSGCSQIDSEGIFFLVFNNPSIRHLCLNHCRGLDDQALYDIAHCIGENLNQLELDFLHNSKMMERGPAIYNLSQRCPNIAHLSLCRFFGDSQSEDELEEPNSQIEYRIEGLRLREVDLYGNYFTTLPMLPPTIRSIRLSVTGQENVLDMVSRLTAQRHLITIHLQLVCLEEDARSIENANTFLCHFIPHLGSKITRLHVTVHRLVDTALSLITQSIPNLCHLALDVTHVSPYHLRRLFSGGIYSQGARLRSLKLSRLRITYRALFAIGRGARSLIDLETSYMPCVDDRFLVLLAENCKQLSSVNFNGCKFVTDKGMAALARNCLLKEVRIRGTACTDKSIYVISQFCGEIEWIAHTDFSGRPKISDKALKSLRDACIQRVIC